MELTGKLYYHFGDWLFDTHGIKPKFIDEMNKKILQYYIIEWLDSVGIYIEVTIYPTNKIINFVWSVYGEFGDFDYKLYDSRQQATEIAIERVIINYNNKYEEEYL